MRKAEIPKRIVAALFVLIGASGPAAADRRTTLGEPRQYLLVVNQKEHSLSKILMPERRVTAKAVLGVNGHEIAVSADKRFAYVPIYGDSAVGKPGTDGSSIDVIDVSSMQPVAAIDLGGGVRPHGILIGPDKLLWVTAELAEAVFLIDPRRRRVVGRIPTGRPQSHMLAFSRDRRRAYTANVSTGSISVIDVRKHRLLTIVPVAQRIQRVTVTTDGRHVLTHDVEAPRIAVIDTSTNKLDGWIALPGVAYASAATPDGRYLVVASPQGSGAAKGEGAVYLIDLQSKKVASSLSVKGAPSGVTLSDDGSRAFLPCPSAGKIVVLNIAAKALEPDVVLTPGVDGVASLASHRNRRGH